MYYTLVKYKNLIVICLFGNSREHYTLQGLIANLKKVYDKHLFKILAQTTPS